MTRAFPGDDELAAFFGAPPEVEDKGIPLYYNSIKFTRQDEKRLVIFEASPSYGDFRIRLLLDGTPVFDVSLHNVGSCEISGDGAMRLGFPRNARTGECIFRMRPAPSVEFEC